MFDLAVIILRMLTKLHESRPLIEKGSIMDEKMSVEDTNPREERDLQDDQREKASLLLMLTQESRCMCATALATKSSCS
eukprot:1373469-Amorphochlora_amoeboformis.AAC.1